MNFISKTIPELVAIENDVTLPRSVRDTAGMLWMIQHLANIRELHISWENDVK